MSSYNWTTVHPKIYGYIGEVSYNVVFSTYFTYLNLVLKTKRSFLEKIKTTRKTITFSIVLKTINNTTVKKDIWIVFINRIQPSKTANIWAAFFMCTTMMKHNSWHRTTFHALLLQVVPRNMTVCELV